MTLNTAGDRDQDARNPVLMIILACCSHGVKQVKANRTSNYFAKNQSKAKSKLTANVNLDQGHSSVKLQVS